MRNDLSAEQLRQEVTVTLPLSAVLRLAELEAPRTVPIAMPEGFAALPAVGSEWQGGIYAGLSIDEGKVIALVLLPGEEKLNWEEAKAWAQKQGGALPSRIDQLVLFKNVKGEFKDAWYWSGEQYAGNGVFAWYQLFGYGYQNFAPKDFDYRARAVRRLPIQ